MKEVAYSKRVYLDGPPRGCLQQIEQLRSVFSALSSSVFVSARGEGGARANFLEKENRSKTVDEDPVGRQRGISKKKNKSNQLNILEKK